MPILLLQFKHNVVDAHCRIRIHLLIILTRLSRPSPGRTQPPPWSRRSSRTPGSSCSSCCFLVSLMFSPWCCLLVSLMFSLAEDWLQRGEGREWEADEPEACYIGARDPRYIGARDPRYIGAGDRLLPTGGAAIWHQVGSIKTLATSYITKYWLWILWQSRSILLTD